MKRLNQYYLCLIGLTSMLVIIISIGVLPLFKIDPNYNCEQDFMTYGDMKEVQEECRLDPIKFQENQQIGILIISLVVFIPLPTVMYLALFQAIKQEQQFNGKKYG